MSKKDVTERQVLGEFDGGAVKGPNTRVRKVKGAERYVSMSSLVFMLGNKECRFPKSNVSDETPLFLVIDTCSSLRFSSSFLCSESTSTPKGKGAKPGKKFKKGASSGSSDKSLAKKQVKKSGGFQAKRPKK